MLLKPGDAILLRGMAGFWPRICRDDDGLVSSMDGETLGHRIYAQGRKDAVLLILAVLQTRHDNPGDFSALHVLTPRAGTCWAWLDGLFRPTLGNAVLL